VKINHYKGVEWVDALNQSRRLAGKFYVDESGKLPVMLYPKGDKVCIYVMASLITVLFQFVCIRPNHSVVDVSFEMSHWQTQFKLKEEPVDPSSMAQIWRECYQETANKCIHEYTNVRIFFIFSPARTNLLLNNNKFNACGESDQLIVYFNIAENG